MVSRKLVDLKKKNQLSLPARSTTDAKVPPMVDSILYVRNLPSALTGDEIYKLFGQYGGIRQIRKGNVPNTRGSAFVVFEEAADAQSALKGLAGFNLAGRYLVVEVYQPQSGQADRTYKKLATYRGDEEKEEFVPLEPPVRH